MKSFRAAVESRDTAALTEVLHSDVTFSSPAVFRPYVGRAAVLTVLQAVVEVFEDFSYIAEFRDGADEVLRFRARVGDRSVEGVDLIRHDADGRVLELTVMVRPLSGLHALVAAMQAKLEEQAREVPASPHP